LQRLQIDGATLENRTDSGFHAQRLLSGRGAHGFLDCGQGRLSG
jgi:hypothetical protein